MKTFLAALAALALTVFLASCAPAPTDAGPQTIERPAVASTQTPAPVEPPAHDAPAPEPAPAAPALAIAGVESMAFPVFPAPLTLDPPTLGDVFEIRDAGHGYAADTAVGPRFLLAHATSPGRTPAPGNAWQELQKGDRIEALSSAWRIVERVEAPKSWLTEDPALVDRTFGAGPGTLILITCVPRWEGRATHNLIIIAELEGAS